MDSQGCLDCSQKYAKYVLKKNLHGRVAPKKPLLNTLKIPIWIQWCKSYPNFSATYYKKVIFFDDYYIERHGSRRTFVWHTINVIFNYKYVLKTIKYGCYVVLIWRLIKAGGTRTLIRCPQILNFVNMKLFCVRGF